MGQTVPSQIVPSQIVLGSRNPKKSAEMAALLEPHGFQVVSVAQFPAATEVVEDGHSFAENAAKKASQTAQEIGQWVLAEDSGLCVDALDGAPGIYSARFAGEQATDEANNRLLIEKLAEIPDERRGAHYVCHVCLANPDGQIELTEEARCLGRIGHKPMGSNGFGYDPYFILPAYHRTFGQLSPLVKSVLSHRARAFSRFVPKLLKLRAERQRSGNSPI